MTAENAISLQDELERTVIVLDTHCPANHSFELSYKVSRDWQASEKITRYYLITVYTKDRNSVSTWGGVTADIALTGFLNWLGDRGGTIS